MGPLSKIFRYGVSALLGVVVGVLFYSCLMIVEVETAYMLPELEPEDHVVVIKNNSLTKALNLYTGPEEGDIILYEALVFSIDGEGLQRIRRITGEGKDQLYVDSDVKTTTSRQDSITEGEVLGKVVMNLNQMDII